MLRLFRQVNVQVQGDEPPPEGESNYNLRLFYQE
jgi:hypothetical protein